MFRAKLLGIVLVAGLVSLGLVLSQVANAVEYVSDANTVLLMHFNEGSGQPVGDASGYGNNGFRGVAPYVDADDPNWTTGKYGGGLDFSPVGWWEADVVNVVGSTSLEMSTALTMECWFSPVANLGGGLVDPQQYEVLMTYHTDWPLFTPLQYQFTYIGVGGAYNGKIVTTINKAVGGYSEVFTTTNSWTAGTWYHIAGVYDGSTLKVYVNGVLENSTSASGILVDVPISPIPLFRVGANPYQRYGWNGRIDEVRISNVGRTAAEIAYGASDPVSCPDADGDGVIDSVETAGGWDPADSADNPMADLEAAEACIDDTNLLLGTIGCPKDSLMLFYLPPGIDRAQDSLSKNPNAVKVLGVKVQ